MYCTSLTTATIGNGLNIIAGSTFYSCTNLTSVTLPNSVTNIGDWAFFECTSLTNVTLPNSVTSIGAWAFELCTSLTSITIPNRVASLGNLAFYACTSLTGVYFRGNAPSIGSLYSTNATNATIYYLPGTTGWGLDFGGRPAVLWNPAAQTIGPDFGVRTNRFGFNIAGTANIPIVIEAGTNLANPVWVSLQSCTLTNGSIYFSDPQWTNYPARFYRLRSP